MLLFCNLVKVASMQCQFAEVPQESVLTCFMFYTNISMKTREEMSSELIKMFARKDEAAVNVNFKPVTYAQVHEMLVGI